MSSLEHDLCSQWLQMRPHRAGYGPKGPRIVWEAAGAARSCTVCQFPGAHVAAAGGKLVTVLVGLEYMRPRGATGASMHGAVLLYWTRMGSRSVVHRS